MECSLKMIGEHRREKCQKKVGMLFTLTCLFLFQISWTRDCQWSRKKEIELTRAYDLLVMGVTVKEVHLPVLFYSWVVLFFCYSYFKLVIVFLAPPMLIDFYLYLSGYFSSFFMPSSFFALSIVGFFYQSCPFIEWIKYLVLILLTFFISL